MIFFLPQAKSPRTEIIMCCVVTQTEGDALEINIFKIPQRTQWVWIMVDAVVPKYINKKLLLSIVIFL